MNICTIEAKSLTTDLVDQWSRLQEADSSVDSPFFRPEFTQAVAAVRDDVEVAVIRQGSDCVGFFPFQRLRANVAVPVGDGVNDFQGVIGGRNEKWTASELLRGCELRAWKFDHLVSQEPLQMFHGVACTSPYIDLSNGFEAYRVVRRNANSSEPRQTLRKGRKLEREIGPLRLVSSTRDPEVLETLIEWKKQQFKKTGVADAFDFEWIVALLHQVVERQTNGFTGMLSALYAGDTLVAIHLGLRSHGVLHWWFPAYNSEFSKYSPGLVLITEIAKAANSLGITRLDLGKGKQRYKENLMSGATIVSEGAVDFRMLHSAMWRTWFRTRDWVRSSRFRSAAHRLDRAVSKINAMARMAK